MSAIKSACKGRVDRIVACGEDGGVCTDLVGCGAERHDKEDGDGCGICYDGCICDEDRVCGPIAAVDARAKGEGGELGPFCRVVWKWV